jgi:protein SCO1/2
VRFVLITVDPERDTSERLKKYLNVFNPSFIGLTGTPAELESVYAAYGVYHEKAPAEHGAAGYSVMHTLAVYVIDRDGRWRLLEDYSAPPEDMAHDARILLKE